MKNKSEEICKNCIYCSLLCYDISMTTFYWCDKKKQQLIPTDTCEKYKVKQN